MDYSEEKRLLVEEKGNNIITYFQVGLVNLKELYASKPRTK